MTRSAYDLAEEALRLARGAGLTIATAESCTGGLVSGALTEVPGSSDAMDRGFVTYSNAAKTELLGVPADLIERCGAVSEDVARAMAEGALAAAKAGVAVAITGVAGPGGGTPAKPVGLVHFAAVRRGQPTITRERRFGDLGRAEIRRLSVLVALELLAEAAGRTETA
ncbi:CinA family protein [Chenggangzhangella methanolivorans]|uniref:Nicotinamide-nucleotide amidohydrolase family protein n=1 Tax=Chenggangzhangella methanolivorans TaxID=1437009 RepID=A0A9E6UNM1_9HYPH|nr:nicotinamide-nucleotide amidohydrolase family protein [Chenggangzhangella methanolivorans]QZO00379.1 nicotinamide-nucleotide amidohydrolase family protein [Chenggangzhangella methanolivorans]